VYQNYHTFSEIFNLLITYMQLLSFSTCVHEKWNKIHLGPYPYHSIRTKMQLGQQSPFIGMCIISCSYLVCVNVSENPASIFRVDFHHRHTASTTSTFRAELSRIWMHYTPSKFCYPLTELQRVKMQKTRIFIDEKSQVSNKHLINKLNFLSHSKTYLRASNKVV
jgi:hypothetical protein